MDKSTTAAGKRILVAALAGVDAALAEEIQAEPNWRKTYVSYLLRVAAIQLRSKEACLRVATQALAQVCVVRFKNTDGGVLTLLRPGTSLSSHEERMCLHYKKP